MKIAILSWEYPPHVVGGLGRHVAELSPALASQKIEVHVVTPVSGHQSPSTSVEAGVVVHRVSVQTNPDDVDIHQKALDINQALYTYADHHLPTDFDLIHVHDWLTSFVGMALQKIWQCPLITTIHATERGRVRGYVSNNLQRAIDKAEYDISTASDEVIVCSQAMFNEVESFFRAESAKLHIIPNGVELKTHPTISPEALTEFRTQYAKPDEKIVFSVARLVYEKGLHLIIQAAPAILEQYPNTRFIIAGRGPEAENLQQQAEMLGVRSQIDFIGFVSDEARDNLFRVADCAIFPSLYEPFGIVALEAMAHYCPVIVSDIGGLAEVVEHQKTGITVYANDENSIAWGVLHIFNQPDIAKDYAVKAYHAVQHQFNWERIAKLTKDVYAKVL